MSIGTDSRSLSPVSNGLNEGSNQICLCQREPHIPRPRNGKNGLYYVHQHAGVVARNPGLSNPDISKIIGEQWRQLPDKTKEEWKTLAEEEKSRHLQQYPDYRYRPKRNSRFGGQALLVGSQSDAVELHTMCQRCGGRSNNAATSAGGVQDNSVVNMPPPSIPLPLHHRRVSSPHSAHPRPRGEILGPPHHPRYEDQPIFIQHTFPPQRANGIYSDLPEAKRRRFNSNADLPQYRVPCDATHRSPRNVFPSRLIAQSPTVTQRTPVSQLSPRHQSMPHNQHSLPKRDPQLTLPPLQTSHNFGLGSQSTSSFQSQRASIEAMVMSIPVLNKIKILSQISPSPAATEPGTQAQCARGAIIAVEGMDAASVSCMTSSLAEQLEKEGKFAVRIFGGPDPYLLHDAHLPAGTSPRPLSYADFLTTIHQWHAVSAEMIEYITRGPRDRDSSKGEHVVIDLESMDNTSQNVQPILCDTRGYGNAKVAHVEACATRPKTPIAAVSPKTITQTASLSLKSPSAIMGGLVSTGDRMSTDVPRPGSRIPAAALAQHAEAKSKGFVGLISQNKSSVSGVKTSPSRTSQAQSELKTPIRNEIPLHSGPVPEKGTARHRSPTSGSEDELVRKQESKTATLKPIPVAIVPHYQLTTVNLSSINMPITDAYSPHSHWQWLATLWRGCVGPDITIVIKATNDDGDLMSSESHVSRPILNGAGMTAMTTTRAGIPSELSMVSGGAPMSASASASASASGQFPVMTPTSAYYAHTHAHTHHPHSHPTHHQIARSPTTNITPGQVHAAGVEVRLSDCKTIIVRTSEGTSRNNSIINNRHRSNSVARTSGGERGSTTTQTRLDAEMDEAWEKAKRRVGFEVEEFLRR